MGLRWGIDLGGTKIEGVVLDSQRPLEPIARLRIATEQAQGYDHICRQIAKLVELLSAETGQRPTQLGIGTPGVTDPDSGLLKNSNTVCLNGQPLLSDLGGLLAIPIIGANDANCFALAEATLGAAVGFDTVFGVIMGTGVGGGLVVHGRVLEGRHGIAGEWGHNELDTEGVPCYCGKRGCVETVLSGPAIARRFHARGGNELTLKEISNLSEQGDSLAQQILTEAYAWFGKAISNVVNIFDPHAIVLGGGVGNIEGFYTQGVTEVAKHVFNPRFACPILRPKLGDSAGVFGAAMLTA